MFSICTWQLNNIYVYLEYMHINLSVTINFAFTEQFNQSYGLMVMTSD